MKFKNLFCNVTCDRLIGKLIITSLFHFIPGLWYTVWGMRLYIYEQLFLSFLGFTILSVYILFMAIDSQEKDFDIPYIPPSNSIEINQYNKSNRFIYDDFITLEMKDTICNYIYELYTMDETLPEQMLGNNFYNI